MQKPRIVLLNKIDMEGAYDRAVELAEKIRKAEPDTAVIPVSVMEGRGMKDAQRQIVNLVNEKENRNDKIDSFAEQASEETSSFMSSRAYIDDDDDGIQYPGSEQ